MGRREADGLQRSRGQRRWMGSWGAGGRDHLEERRERLAGGAVCGH